MRYISYFYLLCAILILPPQKSAFADTQFGYLRLNDVFTHLYHDNPELKAARAELEATKEQYPQARAGWLPSLNADASIFATDIDSGNFSNGDGATTKEYNIQLDQPIFRGGRTFAEVAQAKDLIRAGEFLLMKREQELLLDAAEAYMNLIHDAEMLSLRRESEALLQTEYNATQERLTLGDITRTDVQQAMVRLARAKSEHQQAQANLDISKANFERASGLPYPRQTLIPSGNFPFPASIDGLIALAEENNPELHLIDYRHRAAEHNVDATFRELMPQISAFASYSHQYDPQPGIVDESETQTIGLRATIALFQGGATRSRVREARSQKEQRRYEIMDTRRKVKESVLSHWHNYQAAALQIKNRYQEIQAAQDALTGVREEAKIGQRTTLDILDADAEELNARIAFAHAKRDELVAKFTLAKTLGILKADALVE